MNNPLPCTRTRIKVCGLTREQDVDAAVAAGVDAIGFVLYPLSGRFVSAARAAELARRLPPFVTPVLLFVNAGAIEIIAACARIPGATVQFHGDELPSECLQIARPFIRAARIALDEDGFEGSAAAPGLNLIEFANNYRAAQAILLDAHVASYGGGGKVFNWSRLPTNVNAHLVLSGGLTHANVADGIAQLRPRCGANYSLAVDVSSGVETAKGIKNAELMHQFTAAVRAADQSLFAQQNLSP